MINLENLSGLHEARTSGIYTVRGLTTRDKYTLKAFFHQDLDFTLDELLLLSSACIFSDDGQWCRDRLARDYQVDPFLLEQCRIYAWQRFRGEDWWRIVEMYNLVYRLQLWTERFNALPHVPEFMQFVRLEVLYKYDTNTGNPAYARYRHRLGEEVLEKYHSIFLDGFHALAVYYKDKYQGVLSLDYKQPHQLEHPVSPLIVQLQGVKRGALQWKTNVRSLLLSFVQEVFAGESLYLQSARHNIYRSLEAMRKSRLSTRNSTPEQLAAHLVPMSRLKASYDTLAKAHGFVYDGVTQDYVDFATVSLPGPTPVSLVA